MKRHLISAALLALGTAACGPRIQPEPILQNGGTIRSLSDSTVGDVRAAGDVERQRLAAQALETTAAALEGCAPAVCEAVMRGELLPGMSEAQVLAATRTTAEAWERRGSGGARVLVAAQPGQPIRDAVGELALVALQDGRVRSYTYREPQGLRTVATAAGASRTARTAAQAEALLREGDDYAARGRLDLALERYDRADVLRPNHPETTLHIARVLDKQLRPIEAQIRYQLFLHQLELERIAATGDAYAKLAGAIAEAQRRIIVLERQR